MEVLTSDLILSSSCDQCISDLPVLLVNSENYKSHYPNRNLQAFSTRPLLVQPAQYAGDPKWVSDTETSTLWDDDNVPTDWRGSHKTLKGAPQSDMLQATYKDEL